MYWFGFIAIAFFIVIFGVGTVVSTVDDDSSGGSFFLATAASGLIMWVFLENATYKVGQPTYIKPDMVSKMSDKEVAILRYKDFQETYKLKTEYDAIVNSRFLLEEKIEYNIQGEENGTTYVLKIK